MRPTYHLAKHAPVFRPRLETWRHAKDLLKEVRQDVHETASVGEILKAYARQAEYTSVARITSKRYVLEGKRFSLAKATSFFDNSRFSNRFNGGNLDDDYEEAQPAIYVATQGKNGLYPAITTEKGYYSRKSEYAILSALKESRGEIPIEELRSFFDGGVLMPPDQIVVRYKTPTLWGAKVWSTDSGLADLEYVLRAPLLHYTDILRKILAEAPRGEVQALLSAAAERQLRELDSDEALPLGTILTLPDYTIPAAIGNIGLALNIGVKFESTRADILMSKDYMLGSYNLALPTSKDKANELVPDKVYVFDASRRKLESFDVDAFEDGGAGTAV